MRDPARPQIPIDHVSYPSLEEAQEYLNTGAWYSKTLGEMLYDTACRLPDKYAIVTNDQRLTYAQLDMASETLALNLAGLGLCPGDRAMFQMGSVMETAIALVGCAKAGIIPVCALPQHRAIEIHALTERTRPKAYFVQADFGKFDLLGFAGTVAERYGISYVIAARAGDDVGGNVLHLENLIIPTSQTSSASRVSKVGVADVLMLQLSGGTTNIPKIIPRFHGEHLGQAAAWARRTAMDDSSVALYNLPLIHNAGLVAMLYPCLLVGGTFVLVEKAGPKEFFSLIEREKVTHSLSIGPASIKIVEYENLSDHDISSLQLLTNFDGSETMEGHIGVPCLNIYGITEGLVMGSEITSPDRIRYETVGWPLSPQEEIRILIPNSEQEVQPGDVGELCFRGPSSTRGYYDAPEENRTSFTGDGFFRTGDLLVEEVIDDRKCYSFRGRIKDNIDRGGEKFGAEEVENLIGGHPDILDAKIVAMPDRLYGEKACAFLIMAPNRQAPTVAALGKFLLDQGLAKFKLPERIEIIESMPVTRVGKADKQALRERVAENLAVEQSGNG